MSGTFIALGGGGSATGSLYWGDPVASFSALPVSGTNGETHLALDTGVLYYWNGSTWNADATLAGAILSSQVLSSVTTNVGATGVFGFVTSIILTPGTWLLSGVAGFDYNSLDITRSLSTGISSTADGSGLSAVGACVYPLISALVDNPVLPAPTQTVTLASTTTYYLNTRFYYPSGTPKHFGRLEARYLGG